MTSENKRMKQFVRRAPVTTDSHKAVMEYFLSKQEDYNVRKYPEWDKPRVYPALEVVRARCELAQVEEELRVKWAYQEKMRSIMNEQWDEMRKEELTLRESFIKFNEFVKENQSKRERAELKIAEERSRQAKRLEEIKELTENLNRMKEVRDKVRGHVEEYKKYQNYLENVINETGEFQSIQEIFNRYETLMDARMILSEHQDKNLQILEEQGTELYHMTEVKTQKFMGLTTMLAQLQARHDKAEVRARKWETVVSKIKVAAAEKNLEFTQVKTCCWNLYEQICKRKGISASSNKDDIERQLNYIKRTILELKRLIKFAKKVRAKGTGT